MSRSIGLRRNGKHHITAQFNMLCVPNLPIDITFSVIPNDIKDTIPVIGTPRLSLSDCLLKEELVGDNKKLHIEIFNADKVKQDEYFLHNAWISGINSETNEIVLICDWVE